jgi:hypothetical protein
MARSSVPVTTSDRAGTALSAATTGDPVNGHSVDNDGAVLLLVENTGATVSRTVTIQITQKVDGFAVAPRTKAIPIGQTHIFGPFPPLAYGAKLLVDVDNAELKVRAVKSA